ECVARAEAGTAGSHAPAALAQCARERTNALQERNRTKRDACKQSEQSGPAHGIPIDCDFIETRQVVRAETNKELHAQARDRETNESTPTESRTLSARK